MIKQYEIVRSYAMHTMFQGKKEVLDVFTGSKEDAIEFLKRTWEELYQENYFEYDDEVVKDGSGTIIWEKGDERIGDSTICIYLQELKSDKISLAKRWVSSSGWRGHYEPIYYVAGCNDTGSYYDSPCPTAVAKRELDLVKGELRKYKIKYREVIGATSNLFCGKRYVVVSARDFDKAVRIVNEMYESGWKEATRLLYVNDLKEVSNG